ncbi:hypothetical protein ACFX1R_035582 [Malus domestica]
MLSSQLSSESMLLRHKTPQNSAVMAEISFLQRSSSRKPTSSATPPIADLSANYGFSSSSANIADVEADVVAARIPKKMTFKKFSFRGVNLDALLDMSTDELVKLFPAIGLAKGSREV